MEDGSRGTSKSQNTRHLLADTSNWIRTVVSVYEQSRNMYNCNCADSEIGSNDCIH